MPSLRVVWLVALVAAVLFAAPSSTIAQTEFHYQYGRLANPFSGERHYASILTVQQASSWSLGDSFVFIDFLDAQAVDSFNDKEFYGE